METVIRRIHIGDKTVEVIAQSIAGPPRRRTPRLLTSLSLRIDGMARQDLTATGASPDQLLDIGIGAARIGD